MMCQPTLSKTIPARRRFQSLRASLPSVLFSTWGPQAKQMRQRTQWYRSSYSGSRSDPPQNGHGPSSAACKFGIASVLLLLTACETFIPPPPQIVSVPIGISCLPATLPQRPKTSTDAELSAIDDYKFTLEIFIERRKLLDYSGELEAVIGACR